MNTMETLVRTLDPHAPDPDILAEAAILLRRGELVAFPTETVYGLGANALDPVAIQRIYTAKGRPATNPLIVHAPDVPSLREVTAEWGERAERLAEQFMPGPLTLVLPRHPRLPAIVTAGGPNVAVRIPAHPAAQALLRAAGLPIAAPSANRSTEISPTRAEHVLKSLGGRIPLILDGGATTGGLESTVLDLTTDPPRLLRPGLINPSEMEAIIGKIALPDRTNTDEQKPMASPGQMARHYAPQTPLELVENDGADRVETLRDSGSRVGWVTCGAPQHVPNGITPVVLSAEPSGYATALYATLHTLDETGLDVLLVQMPPDTLAWLAIRDRLRRAATPEQTE
jgi:L-threonylcarbamoyladenylate synthase